MLAPGLAAFGALYGFAGGKVYPVAPAPGSIASISVIAGAALLAHAVGAALFTVQDLACFRVACTQVSYNPNVYEEVFLHTGARRLSIPYTLSYVLALSCAAFWCSLQTRRLLFVRRATYGWLEPLLSQQSNDRTFVAAFVLTGIEHEGVLLGYEGVVEAINLGDNKEIINISLSSASRFLVRIGSDSMQRVPVDGTMPMLTIDRSQIANIAFEVIEVT